MSDHTQLVIGQRLKSRRQERKMTQAALAVACGITQSYVAHVETGTVPLTDHIFGLLASALGTTVETLCLDIDKPPMTESERDAQCRELVTAATSNVFAQAGLMVALGCVAGCKPVSKARALELAATYAEEYQITMEALKPILIMVKERGVI